jgi:hypothetical protein
MHEYFGVEYSGVHHGDHINTRSIWRILKKNMMLTNLARSLLELKGATSDFPGVVYSCTPSTSTRILARHFIIEGFIEEDPSQTISTSQATWSLLEFGGAGAAPCMLRCAVSLMADQIILVLL